MLHSMGQKPMQDNQGGECGGKSRLDNLELTHLCLIIFLYGGEGLPVCMGASEMHHTVSICRYERLHSGSVEGISFFQRWSDNCYFGPEELCRRTQ